MVRKKSRSRVKKRLRFPTIGKLKTIMRTVSKNVLIECIAAAWLHIPIKTKMRIALKLEKARKIKRHTSRSKNHSRVKTKRSKATIRKMRLKNLVKARRARRRITN